MMDNNCLFAFNIITSFIYFIFRFSYFTFCYFVTYIRSCHPSLNYFSILNFTNGIYFPLSLFLVATKLAWGIYNMFVCE